MAGTLDSFRVGADRAGKKRGRRDGFLSTEFMKCASCGTRVALEMFPDHACKQVKIDLGHGNASAFDKMMNASAATNLEFATFRMDWSQNDRPKVVYQKTRGVDDQAMSLAAKLDGTSSVRVALKEVGTKQGSLVPLQKHPRAEMFSTKVMSLLSSALQKSVRLCRPMGALKIARAMLFIDAIQLLRRLPIIVLEDSILHPDLGVVVWLMAAVGKGRQLSTKDEAFIAQFVYEVAAVPERNDVSRESVTQTFQGPQGLAEHTLLMSLKIRSKHGGKPWDLDLIDQAVTLWRNKFCNCGSVDTSGWLATLRHMHTATTSTAVDNLGRSNLKLGDIPFGAVDFHCSPVLRAVLHKMPPLVRPRLREMMWALRSSRSLKKLKTETPITDDVAKESFTRETLKAWSELAVPLLDMYSRQYAQQTLFPLLHGESMRNPTFQLR